jgi:hypothetical protein
MSKCRHPYEARIEGAFEAILPNRGETLRENVMIDRERAVVCGLCGTVIVPDGVLVQAAPVIPRPKEQARCACGRPLEQGYAREMGECVSCCLKRLRQDRDKPVLLTSNKSLARGRKRAARVTA